MFTPSLIKCMLLGGDLGEEDRAVLIYGPPGSGKTSLACALAREHLHNGQNVLYYNTDEPSSSLERLWTSLPDDERKRLGFRGNKPENLRDITEAILGLRLALYFTNFQVVVIDSINHFGVAGSTPQESREIFRRVREELASHSQASTRQVGPDQTSRPNADGETTPPRARLVCYFVSEDFSGDHISHMAYMVDMVVRCRPAAQKGTGDLKHVLTVEKARRNNHLSGEHQYSISETNVEIYPNLTSLPEFFRMQGHESKGGKRGRFWLGVPVIDRQLELDDATGLSPGMRVYIKGEPLTQKFHLALNIVNMALVTPTDPCGCKRPLKVIVTLHDNLNQIEREILQNAVELVGLSDRRRGVALDPELAAIKGAREMQIGADGQVAPNPDPIRELIEARIQTHVRVVPMEDQRNNPERFLFKLRAKLAEFQADRPEGIDLLVIHDLASVLDHLPLGQHATLVIGLLELASSFRVTPVLVHTSHDLQHDLLRLMDCVIETVHVRLGNPGPERPCMRLLYYRPGRSFPDWYHHIESRSQSSLFRLNRTADSYVPIAPKELALLPLHVHFPPCAVSHGQGSYRIHLSKMLQVEQEGGDSTTQPFVKGEPDLLAMEAHYRSIISSGGGLSTNASKVFFIDEHWMPQLISADVLYPLRELMGHHIPGWPDARAEDWYETTCLSQASRLLGNRQEYYGLPSYHNPSLLAVDKALFAQLRTTNLVEEDGRDLQCIGWQEFLDVAGKVGELKESIVAFKSSLASPQDIVCLILDLFWDHLLTQVRAKGDTWHSGSIGMFQVRPDIDWGLIAVELHRLNRLADGRIFRQVRHILEIDDGPAAAETSDSGGRALFTRIWLNQLDQVNPVATSIRRLQQTHYLVPVPTLPTRHDSYKNGRYLSGDWYVGVLKSSPNPRNAIGALRIIASTDSARYLYNDGFGLPARKTFYRTAAPELEPLYNQLAEGRNVVRRSSIHRFLFLSQLLLHQFLGQLLQCTDSDFASEADIRRHAMFYGVKLQQILHQSEAEAALAR